MRTGSEPTTARSPLRMRFWLSVWGLIWAVVGLGTFAVTEHPGWAITSAVLCVIIMADLLWVVHRLHQGPHYQPGPDIPPYEPDHGGPRARR
ncbi:DUF6343 family protein [Streptomyces sp. NPDC054841]